MSNQNSAERRITFCITELDIGGAEKAMVRVAMGLSAKGWSVRVISLRDEGPMAAEFKAVDIPVTSLRCGGFWDVRAFFRLRKELSKHPPDLLVCFLHQANIYGRLAAQFAGRPVVVSGIRVADRRRWVILSDRLTRCCVDLYIAVSRQVADVHAGFCKITADKICAIPNGVDLPNPEELPKRNADHENTLLFVGRLTPQKDPLCLIEAFATLPASLQKKTTLKFVGEGPLRNQIACRIEQHRLAESVQFTGHSDHVPELMRQATLLVLPSRYEGLPNVVLEAMANGLPVVASNVDGVKELIESDRTGWLVPPCDSNALANALEFALTESNVRSDIAESAQAVVSESFTWKSVVDEYDRVLSSLDADRHRR